MKIIIEKENINTPVRFTISEDIFKVSNQYKVIRDILEETLKLIETVKKEG